jgi:Tfp pilus assembly protein PilF
LVKKPLIAALLVLGLGACATFKPQPPAFYIDDIPQSLATGMPLEERISADEAWKNLKAGDAVRAEKALLRLDAESPLRHAGLGYLRFQEGDLEAAGLSFRKALDFAPGFVPALIGLAQIAQAEGKEDQVLSLYREILKGSPDHPWARPRFEAMREGRTSGLLDEAGRAEAAGDIEGAKKAYLKALFYAPESVEANLHLARLYRKEGNLSSAIIHYKSANAADSKDKSLLKEYAETLFAAEQFGRSLDIYEILAERDPKNGEVRERIEGLKNRLGIYELPSLYNAISASAAIAREDLAALITVKFKGILDGADLTPPILVDISVSWASKFILKVTSLGIMDSYDNHTFLPRKIINRAELAETLVRLLNHLKNKGRRFSQQVAPDRIRIADVPPDNYYHAPITQILSYQIMDLTPQRTFRPDAVVSGKEAEKILDIILALTK